MLRIAASSGRQAWSRQAPAHPSQCAARQIHSTLSHRDQRHGAGGEAETVPDDDSIQARLIKKLQERYVPPQPPRQPSRPASSPHQFSPASPPETEAQTAEAVSQVVAESLSEAQATGAAQAAALAALKSDVHAGSIDHNATHVAPEMSDGQSADPVAEPVKVGQHEDGRFLPKTPDNQPWNAIYVRPAHAGSKGGESVPSIYYGKLLRLQGTTKSTSQRLRDLGVNPSSLPIDDAKAMRAVREGISRFERAGRVYGAKTGARDYKYRKLTQDESLALQAELEAEAAKAADTASHQTTMGRNLPSTSHDSGRAPGGGGGRSGGLSMRRWTSIADERIEAARAAGFFKENSLRGKPLLQEVHERNPYLGYEERLMNRIVKKQGASPPWVELNNTFHSHLDSFRSKLVDSFSRRAVRELTQAGSLLSSGGPGTGTAGGTDQQRRAYFVNLAERYRDPTWEAQERGYHEETIKDLNNTLRRHNHLAPPTARKPMVSREAELAKCYIDSIEPIADGLEDSWLLMTGRKVPPNQTGGLFGQQQSNSYDIWGRPVEAGTPPTSWSLGSLFSRSNRSEEAALNRTTSTGDGEDGAINRASSDDTSRRRSTDDGIPVLGAGLLRKIRQLLGRSSGDESRQHRDATKS